MMTRRIVEIPAYLFGIWAVERLGRRMSLCSGLILGGISCLITGLVPEGILYLQYTTLWTVM